MSENRMTAANRDIVNNYWHTVLYVTIEQEGVGLISQDSNPRQARLVVSPTATRVPSGVAG